MSDGWLSKWGKNNTRPNHVCVGGANPAVCAECGGEVKIDTALRPNPLSQIMEGVIAPQTATAEVRVTDPYVRVLTAAGAGLPLCEQIAHALQGIALAPLAKKSGVSVNTLVRAKAGEGIRLETLEKVAKVLGWTITIMDAEGQTLVRAQAPLSTAPAASAE